MSGSWPADHVNAEVGLAILDGRQDIVGGQIQECGFVSWDKFYCIQQLRTEGNTKWLWARLPNGDLACDALGHLANTQDGALEITQDHFRLGEELAANGREVQWACGAHWIKLDAQSRFQLLDPPRDRWL